MSLLFYSWGEIFYVLVMIVSIISNYILGKLIYYAQTNKNNYKYSQIFLTIGIIINIGLLITFKYTNFITDNINSLLSIVGITPFDLKPIHLPLGLSFFTFQAITYIVDVYRKEARVQDNIYDLALYISLFPKLLAGPIVRYRDISRQITDRSHSLDLFASGIQRFIIGLAKKVLIANSIGEIADNIFSLSGNDLTMQLAWIGIVSYTLQIYIDFSGYSDMAIGLGRMFGFQFQENFNYPYIAKSVREFWRRWHISLSTFFKDYVYIPLGGNRVSPLRVYCNLLTVFLLTGVWHGASWKFVIWGLFHGFFITIEHMGFSTILKRFWKPVQHLYLILVIVSSWVFFRADNIYQAMRYLGAMLNVDNWQTTPLQYAQVTSNEFIYVLVIGIVFSMPIYTWTTKQFTYFSQHNTAIIICFKYIPRLAFLSVLLVLCIIKISSSTYSPFIYFQF